MKKSVVDIYDLQEMTPFFNGRVGTWLGKLLIKCLRVDLVNKVHARNCHLRGAEFTSALLHDPIIDLSYEVHNKEILDHLPEGAFVTVSNHPIGSLDGIMLIDIFASRRPDFKVMVNGILTKIGAMEDNFISVVPDSHKRGANPANVNGVRLSLQRLKEGHPMGFFPAGAISFYNKKEKPVYPVYFDFQNTHFFYWLGNISWQIRTLRIPTEAFNKRGKKADVYIGEPISPEEIAAIPEDKDLAEFLYKRTYGAKK